jgi:UDP-glucose 4-epimerase
MGTEIEPLHVEGRAGDIRHSLADVSRASRDLGFEARTTLEDGLALTVESRSVTAAA